MKPAVIITGASTGIGAELARVFAQKGHTVGLIARAETALQAVADQIAAGGVERPIVLPYDLTRHEASALLSTQLAAKGLEPAILVNNAGFGLIGAAGALDRAEQLAMTDLNVRALTDLTLRFLPAVTRHGGGVLNVASVAGFMPGPGMAVYYATKAYVLSFTEALAEETRGSGIKVSALCPGPVPTAFQARAGMGASAFPKMLAMSAAEVAQIGYDGFMAGQRVIVPGFGNRFVTRLVRFAPRGLVLSTLHRMQRQRKGAKSRPEPARR